jgi:hypothetical protein
MSTPQPRAAFDLWLKALEERHLANLTTSEVTRGLRALSSCYVERREKLSSGGALDGAGKRAAFALFYGPQHFLIAQEIVRHVLADSKSIDRILDLGCGTGSAGAAAAVASGAATIEGCDVNPWAVREANWTYETFSLRGRAVVMNLSRVRLRAAPGTLILAAYSVNELAGDLRSTLLKRLRDAHRAGASLLIVEPIARRVNAWWAEWADIFKASGGREDDWRVDIPLPPRQRLLAKGAGLDVSQLTARSLYLQGRPAEKE